MDSQNTVKFSKAVAIITASNSPKVSFNVPVKDSYSNTYPILIHYCNADLVSKLVTAGYAVGMCDKGMWVEKF